jgi:hypothetical protein
VRRRERFGWLPASRHPGKPADGVTDPGANVTLSQWALHRLISWTGTRWAGLRTPTCPAGRRCLLVDGRPRPLDRHSREPCAALGRHRRSEKTPLPASDQPFAAWRVPLSSLRSLRFCHGLVKIGRVIQPVPATGIFSPSGFSEENVTQRNCYERAPS